MPQRRDRDVSRGLTLTSLGAKDTSQRPKLFLSLICYGQLKQTNRTVFDVKDVVA